MKLIRVEHDGLHLRLVAFDSGYRTSSLRASSPAAAWFLRNPSDFTSSSLVAFGSGHLRIRGNEEKPKPAPYPQLIAAHMPAENSPLLENVPVK